MAKEKISEINVGKLLSEYHNLSNEILIKESYFEGIKRRIAEEVEDYFSDYRGKYYRMKFDGNTCDEATVRIGKIKASFCCDTLHVTFYLVVNPDDLNKTIKWTEKEKKLLAEAKKYWRHSDCDWYVQYFSELEDISDQLKCLKNEARLVAGYFFTFSKAELINGYTVCKENYVLGDRHNQQVMLNMFERKM